LLEAFEHFLAYCVFQYYVNLQQKKGTSRSHERTTALLSTHENSFDLDILGRVLICGWTCCKQLQVTKPMFPT